MWLISKTWPISMAGTVAQLKMANKTLRCSAVTWVRLWLFSIQSLEISVILTGQLEASTRLVQEHRRNLGPKRRPQNSQIKRAKVMTVSLWQPLTFKTSFLRISLRSSRLSVYRCWWTTDTKASWKTCLIPCNLTKCAQWRSTTTIIWDSCFQSIWQTQC